MNQYSDVFTPNEKQFLKKGGQMYLRLLKTMGIFLLLALILSSIAVATAQPEGAVFKLDKGESGYTARFFGEAGDTAQFAFGITEEDGKEYNYQDRHDGDDVDNVWEVMQFMETMDWRVQMQIQFSENLAFDTVEVVKDVSGEINYVSVELYQDGFYRIKITNLSESTLTIATGKTEANLGLIIAAIVCWIIFSITVAIFGFMVHLGFWILFIFLLIKLISIVNEDNRREHPSVIEPRQTQGGMQ